MATLLYNQVEQAYMVGYLAGLVTVSDMEGANPQLKAGIIVGQQYPALDEMIVPGYEMGLKAVNPEIELDMRVLGNWYDGNKAAELAESMIDAGVDVILTVCGGANQGVITAVEERGRYVVYLDDDNYALAPGTIVGCSALLQGRATYEKVSAAVDGELEWGSAEIVDAEDGYVVFIDDNLLYRESVPRNIRENMEQMLSSLRSGDVSLDIPAYWEQ
jgi:simple sugar transport system substrate-binding protein